jgi:RNA polymerase sigma-70 factor, ECF subfamily
MKVAVAGGTGLIGRMIVDALAAGGDTPIVLARSAGVDLIPVSAARRPVYGADRVARFLTGTVRFFKPTEVVRMITVNGAPGLGVFDGDDLTAVASFTMNGDRISRIDVIRAPLKLRKLI